MSYQKTTQIVAPSISQNISNYLSNQTTAEQLQKWDKNHFWHPFTQMQEYAKQDNLIFVKGEGHYLFDISGKKYLDSIASLWCNVHGHAHPRLNQVMVEQISQICHSTTLGVSNPNAIILAKVLAELTGLPHTFYSEDGAEAVEIALKMAFQYWQHQKKPHKKRFLCLDQAYHGDTLGAVSVGGFSLFHQTFAPLLFETQKLHAPYHFSQHHFGIDQTQWNCVEATNSYMHYVRDILITNHQEIAGIIIEGGIQCAAGFLPFPPLFIIKLKELCQEFDVLLIVDEVATGFGRTGKMFASIDEEYPHLKPDILVLGKSIAGGYLPLAVTQTNEKIYNAFLGRANEYKQFFHGHTFTGHSLACRLALESIALIDDEQLLAPDVFQKKEQVIEQCLSVFYEQEVADLFTVKRVGLMLAIELTGLSKLSQKSSDDAEKAIKFMQKIIQNILAQGIYTRPLGYHLIVFPPLSISCEELQHILMVLWNAVKNSQYLSLTPHIFNHKVEVTTFSELDKADF